MSEEPASPSTGDEEPRRRPRRATRPGREHTADQTRAWEDDDRAWGGPGETGDDPLLRERPPHWG